jgi:demethylspheroidene O-methyltransferase
LFFGPVHMSAASVPNNARLSLLDRILAKRDSLIASDRFRRWASAFPLTRPIAQRRARALFDICAGFVYSQVLLTCVRLDLFEILAEGPKSLADLSPRLGLTLDATERLIRAAISLELVAKRSHDRFGLGQLGAAMVGNEGVKSMVEHHSIFYKDLEDPVALLKTPPGTQITELSRYWPYAGAAQPAEIDNAQVIAYSKLMSESQALIASEILDAYPMQRHQCLLDVGGGAGTFLVAAATRHPHLRVKLFDLPAVAAIAKTRFADAGIAARAETFGGDFVATPLPGGADVISLIRVAFDHPDEKVLNILRAIRKVIPDKGTLLIAEPMAGTIGAEAMGDAYFGFYLLAMGRGRSRTADELTALLKTAGFHSVKIARTRMPLQTKLLIARP